MLLTTLLGTINYSRLITEHPVIEGTIGGINSRCTSSTRLKNCLMVNFRCSCMNFMIILMLSCWELWAFMVTILETLSVMNRKDIRWDKERLGYLQPSFGGNIEQNLGGHSLANCFHCWIASKFVCRVQIPSRRILQSIWPRSRSRTWIASLKTRRYFLKKLHCLILL